MKKVLLFIAALFSMNLFAQDDLLSMVEETKDEAPKKVYATFKTYRLGNGQSIETVKKKNLDYRIAHRFGSSYNSSSGPDPLNDAAHQAFGFDIASDIRNSLDYGITDNLTVGIGRSRMNELVDLSCKWKFLTQTTNFSVPISMAFYGNMGYTTMRTSSLYSGIVKDFSTNEAHRISYVAQLIIASKITSWLSLQVIPSYSHRNFIKQAIMVKDGKKHRRSERYFFIGYWRPFKTHQTFLYHRRLLL